MVRDSTVYRVLGWKLTDCNSIFQTKLLLSKALVLNFRANQQSSALASDILILRVELLTYPDGSGRTDAGCYRIFNCFSVLNNWALLSEEFSYHEQKRCRGSGYCMQEQWGLCWPEDQHVFASELQRGFLSASWERIGKMLSAEHTYSIFSSSWLESREQKWQYIINCCSSGLLQVWEFPEKGV